MRAPFSYKKAAVGIAMGVLIVSTATLSYLSYYYTVGRSNVVEATIVQNHLKLVQQSVASIEQKIIDNDRALWELADVNEPTKWRGIVDGIRKADLEVDNVWFLKPDGTILFPPYNPQIRNDYGAVRKHFRDDKSPRLDGLPLNEIHHLHTERKDSYFFASYVMKETKKGEKLLVIFQKSSDRCIALVEQYLRPLSQTQYVRIVDVDDIVVFGDLPTTGKYIVQSGFPSTLYKWNLQMVPRDYAELEQSAKNQTRFIFFLIMLSIFLLFLSLGIIFITARRERQLAKLKEDFISNVSHEMKTPLSLIRMFSEILVMGKFKSEESKQEYYRIIHNESDRMSRLITNLLDFASLDRGKREKRFERTDLGTLVTKALEAYRYQIQKEGFRLVSDIQPHIPEVMADPNALTMAFFNLLDNSLKYSEERKEIKVSLTKVDGAVELAVSDKGLGIPKGEQEQIFEKFYRGNNAAVQRIRGSGIGLSIIRQVAEMHGGEVRVESEPGSGSTFTLRLPLAEPDALPEPAPSLS